MLKEGATVTLKGTGQGTLSWSYDANSDGLGAVPIGTGASVSFKWSGVSRVAEQELGKIRASAPHHTMLRHMLESIARVAHLAPKHSRLARDKGMKPTDTFSWRMVQLHLFSLPSFAKLDKLAAPLQSRGVPILHQDVPPIPLRSAFYDGAVTPASTHGP